MAIADTISSMYENVGEVYDTITNVDVNTGKNLFDISTITENTYIEENGNTGSSQVTNLSDYIEVKPNASYTLSYDYSTLLNSNQRNIIYYDENNTYISGWIYLPTNKSNLFTTPNNAKYIRFSYDKNCYSIMLNEGSTALPYEPYTDTPTYKNIENIPSIIRKSYLEIMNNGIDKIWNNWEKVEGTGETLTLNSTEKAPMKINLKGNTSQETTTGKNLMPSDAIAGNTYNGIAVTLVNGKLHFQGKASAEYFASSNITLPTHLLTTKQYYFKAISNRPSPTRFKIWGYNSSDVLKINIPQDSYFTPEEEIVKYKIVFEYMTTGTSYNFDAQFQIEEGGSFTSYEPYTNGASPNPDYPQDVEVVSGNNSIKVEGKNLLTTLNATSTNKQTTISVSNGIIHDTTSKTGNTEYADVFSFTNVISYGNYGGYVIPQGNIIELEAGTYTFSYHKISGTAPTYDDASKSRNINVYKYGSSTPYTNLGGARIIGDNASVTFTLTEKSKVSLTYGYYFFGDISTDVYFTLQLEKGSTATEYEEYKGASYEINLGKNLLDLQLSIMKSLNTSGTWSENVYTHNGLTLTINDDKTIKINGTATDQETFLLENQQIKYPTGTYYLSGSINGSNNSYDIRMFNYDGTSAVAQCYTGAKEINVINNKQVYNMAIVVRSGQTLNNVVFYPMFSTSNDTNYSPYFTPIELCKIGTYQDKIAKSSGSNFFNPIYVVNNATVNGNNITLTGSTDFYLNGAYSSSANTLFTIPKGMYRCITTNDNVNLSIYGIYEGETTIRGINSNTTIATDITGTFYVKGIRVRSINGNSLNGTTINVYLGTQTSYEPYGKVWYLNKQIGKVVLNGSETISNYAPTSLTGSYQATFETITKANSTDKIVLSDYFTSALLSERTTKTNICYTYTDGLLRIATNVATTMEDFKTWLSTHNTIVYYVLATPTYTEITDTTLISQLEAVKKSYTTQTNISQENNDKPFILDATALKQLT